MYTSFESSGRRPWFPKFRAALKAGDAVDSIDHLLRFKVEKWRGRSSRNPEADENSDEETEENIDFDLGF